MKALFALIVRVSFRHIADVGKAEKHSSAKNAKKIFFVFLEISEKAIALLALVDINSKILFL